MATVATTTLIERVRALTRDYGTALTTLGAGVTDTTGTTLTVASNADMSAGDFVMIDNELMEVVSTSTTTGATVVRGSRGSTAATHSNGALVRIGVVWGNHEVMQRLNSALGSAYPSMYATIDDTTEVIASDTYEYDIPMNCERLVRVEIETGTDGVYLIDRQWSMQDKDTVLIEDAALHATGNTIRMVGIGRFDNLTLTGNLDSDYPTDNEAALEYLVVNAAGRLLTERQVPLGRRDSFVGITDKFQESQPYISLTTGAQLLKYSKQILRECRMQPLQEYLPSISRHYYGRP